MKKTWIVPLSLVLTLAALGAAAAGPESPQSAPAPAVSPAVSSVLGQGESPAVSTPTGASLPLDLLLAPEPIELAPTCRIRCPTTWCQQDNQCTAAPGGICSPVCISKGCCTYPA